jgi:hypothetical protein
MDDKQRKREEQPESRGYCERLWEATHPREADAERERRRRMEIVLKKWQD